MRSSKKKYIIFTTAITVFGVSLNLVLGNIVSRFELPLYLDSIGTMFTAVVGGIAPGMFVGFMTNLIRGFSYSSSFYYGTINVLIAFIAGVAADKGFFDNIKKVLVVLAFYILLSIPCSILTYTSLSRTGKGISFESISRIR